MKILDIYRTAPLGETLLLAGIVTHDIDKPIIPALLILNGLYITTKQFVLRERLERIVKRYGYTSENFAKTTTTWCDRQTARVVAKEVGHLEDYISLCKDSNNGSLDYLLPHF